MSQEKVDRYKEEKRNREKIMKKEKRDGLAVKLGMSVVALALVAWIGASVYYALNAPDPNAELPTYTVNTSSLDDFVQNLNEEE